MTLTRLAGDPMIAPIFVYSLRSRDASLILSGIVTCVQSKSLRWQFRIIGLLAKRINQMCVYAVTLIQNYYPNSVTSIGKN